MAVCHHSSGGTYVSYNSTPLSATESVARKAIYHLRLFDRYHGAGFSEENFNPLGKELSPFAFRGLMRDHEIARMAIIQAHFSKPPYNQVPEAKCDVLSGRYFGDEKVKKVEESNQEPELPQLEAITQPPKEQGVCFQ